MKSCDCHLSRVQLFLAIVCLFPLMSNAQNMHTNALPAPTLPSININNLVNITNFGAVSSTTLTNTTAIQNAINAGATTNGGCTVEIPAGTYLSGPLTLKSSINLQIDSGATLKMLAKSNWPSSTTFINGSSIHDVEISGSGTIDGNAHFGSSEWWGTEGGSAPSGRPNFINFSSSSRILIQDVTLQNPPTFHIMIKGNNADITVQRITMNTPGDSPNTDAFDIASTNVLIKDSSISVGDDDAEIGGSALAAEITITNCIFGSGHGVSIGSITSGNVSNLVVVNCTFNGTDYGIRMKSNDGLNGSSAGGIIQNLSYCNLGMTNILHGAVVIYSYYGSGGNAGTPTSVTPYYASTQDVDVTSIPVWRNITISNVTATVTGSAVPGIIWARMEVPATNILFSHVNISGPSSGQKSFDVYSARGIQFNDCQITPPAGNPTFLLYNAQVTVSNSVPTNTLFTFDGLTTNGYGNTMTFYNAQASLQNTNVLDDGPLTVNASTLTVSNDLVLFPSTVLNYALGTNATKVAVVGNLSLGGTNNISAGAGFTNGTYTLLTYTGTLSGSVPTLGVKPSGYNYAYDTSTAGQIKLVVTQPAPSAPTNLVASGTNLLINLKWNSVSGAATYNLKRGTVNNGPYPTIFSGLTATNYADANVTNAVNYFYVVTAMNGGESTNSLQASATSLPSNQPTNIVLQTSGNQLQLSWPQDHLGWRLQIQTNTLSSGLGANWFTVPNSTNVISTNIVINPGNGSVFLRLVYP
jgi:polygalacturonase